MWRDVLPELAGAFHGGCAGPAGTRRVGEARGDYSLGAFASSMRDLMLALGHERATLVGQSLGGGVVMQFAYQFPERTERLVLVSSGGLGQEVNLLLRALTLPGSDFVLPIACTTGYTMRASRSPVGCAMSVFVPSPHLEQSWESYGRSPTPRPAGHSCIRCARSSTKPDSV